MRQSNLFLVEAKLPERYVQTLSAKARAECKEVAA